MKILHTVESYTPDINGMQEVVRQISERLVDRGHDVTIATSFNPKRNSNIINGVKIVSFNICGNLVAGLSGDIKKYEDFLLNNKFDVTVNFAAQQWATDIFLLNIDKINSKKVFVPTGFSLLNHPKFKSYYNQMRDWMKKYDANIFLSENYRDINLANSAGIEKKYIIPNGADEREFIIKDTKLDIRTKLKIKSRFLLLTVGSHTGLKGHHDSTTIFKKSNIPSSVLVINGNHPKITPRSFIINIIKIFIHAFKKSCKINNCGLTCFFSAFIFNISPKRIFDKKKIILANLDREELVSIYKAADLFLFPSNIECSPIVLFEAVASKTPYLTTDVGNSKEITQWTNGGIVLPTEIDSKGYSNVIINEAVRILEILYKNSERRDILAFNGYDSFEEKFTWQKIAEKYEKLYLELTKN